jgi:biopolymer transport protein ExbD
MAEIIQEEKGQKGGKRKPKKHSTAIDMTPMVDLMCLLITFFMLTTAFSKAKVMEIVLPEPPDKNDTTKQTEVDSSRALTILLSKEHTVYYYRGKADLKAKLIKTDFSNEGIRTILLKYNESLSKKIKELQDKVKAPGFKIDAVMPKKELDSLRLILRENEVVNNYVTSETKKLKAADDLGPIVLIKADEDVKYKDFVDIIDEMSIANIARYAITDIMPVEKDLIKNLDNPVATTPK